MDSTQAPQTRLMFSSHSGRSEPRQHARKLQKILHPPREIIDPQLRIVALRLFVQLIETNHINVAEFEQLFHAAL